MWRAFSTLVLRGDILLPHSAFLEWGYWELVPLARIKFLLLHSQYTSLKKQSPSDKTVYLFAYYIYFMRFFKKFSRTPIEPNIIGYYPNLVIQKNGEELLLHHFRNIHKKNYFLIRENFLMSSLRVSTASA